MTEAEFLAALRDLPLHSGALGLTDDTARLGDLVITKDMIAEGIHFLPDDPPEDVAWKLVAVNLSDLASKGAVPEGVLLGYTLGPADWNRRFLAGLGEALSAFACPLIGGDTVRAPARIFSLTAIGRAGSAPARSGAQADDALWVTGTIGDAGAGLAIARGAEGPAALLTRYRRPTPRLAEGRRIAPLAHAMMDVSDGLLIDAQRMADASGLALTIDLDAIPLSDALVAHAGRDPLRAATAGDDYELLFALPPGVPSPAPATRIGTFAAGAGLSLTAGGAAVALPDRLGWLHP